jgi:hypothetical protein
MDPDKAPFSNLLKRHIPGILKGMARGGEEKTDE